MSRSHKPPISSNPTPKIPTSDNHTLLIYFSSKTTVLPIINIDWSQLLNQLFLFTFCVQQQLLIQSKKSNNKLMLIFRLMLSSKDKKQQQQQQQLSLQLSYDYQCVSQYIYDIVYKQQFIFLEYYQTKFQLPFASQIHGIVICFMTTFQIITNQQNIQDNQIMLLQSINKNQIYNYFYLISTLKKFIKQYRFCSYSIQKIIEDAFLGFRSIISIPNVQMKQIFLKKQKSQMAIHEKDQTFPKLALQQPLLPLYKSLQQIQHRSSIITQDKLKQLNEKQCSQQQFLNYLAYLQYQDKKFNQLLIELNNLGRRNQQIIKQLQQCLIIHDDHNINALYHKIHLQSIKNQYLKKRNSIYDQKIHIFGKSKNSAAQQIQFCLKTIASLKSQQKSSGNFFTKMSQIFYLIPSSQSIQIERDRFDKCPYLIYSKTQFKQGQIKQEQFQDYQEIYPKIKKNINNYQQVTDKIQKLNNNKQNQPKNIFILAHGYQATCGNMQKLKILMKKIFSKGKFFSLKSYTQCMDLSFEQMGLRAAKQIITYFTQIQNANRKINKIIMVGHSMGGIILRASLQHLDKKISKYLHTFISFGTPHLGYFNCKNFFTGAGIQLIQSINSSVSLKQLSNKDQNNIKQTFIYKLAQKGTLIQFQNIILFSSTEDKYVPWNSARIQLYKQPQGIGGKNTSGGWLMTSKKHFNRFVQLQMITQILGIGNKDSQIQTVHRFEVDFNINQLNLDTVIGRTSHIAFLGNQHLIPMAFQQCLQNSIITQLKNQSSKPHEEKCRIRRTQTLK